MQSERHEAREPLLNLPAPVVWVLTSLIVIHVFTAYAPDWLGQAIYDRFAFVPARFAFHIDPASVLARIEATDRLSPFEQSELADALKSGPIVYLTPVTYAFLHGNWTHLTMNALTLTAFGAPVARRLGGALFLSFMGTCAIVGALTHLALHPIGLGPVVGASAAISGTMAAIARFAFAPGSRLSEGARIFGSETELIPLAKLAENRQAAVFILLWLGLNFLLGSHPEAIGVADAVAWEAHAGGFLFGLISFGLFDRAARRAH